MGASAAYFDRRRLPGIRDDKFKYVWRCSRSWHCRSDVIYDRLIWFLPYVRYAGSKTHKEIEAEKNRAGQSQTGLERFE